jgi:CRISPR system Cascade subunit CasA
MPDPFRFDLIDEPWIQAVTLDGARTKFGIIGVLRQAHLIAGLAGDLPTQDPPVLRLLLAVLHRALDGPRSLDAWESLWNAGPLPVDTTPDTALIPESIGAYLERWRPRFDLFDADQPFLQAAGLRDVHNSEKPSSLLMPQVASGNNVPLFSGRHDDDPWVLTPAQAARWLLHAHAWDTAAIKTGAVDDPLKKDGKSFAQLAPLGRIGVVIPHGPTLRDTLLLNLVPRGMDPILPNPADDTATWEQQPLSGRRGARPVVGPAGLYSFPSRRIRLVPSAGPSGVEVCSVILCNGDRIEDQQLVRLEPHTAFYRSETAEKEAKKAPVYLPRRHNAGEALWRGLPGLLALHTAAGAMHAGKDAAPTRAPMMLLWLQHLLDIGLIPDRLPLRITSHAVFYGTKQAVVDDLAHDDMPMSVVALSAADPTARQLLLTVVSVADKVAGALRLFERDLDRVAGDRRGLKERSTRADALIDDFYFGLDEPFRRLAADLAAQTAAPPDLAAGWADVLSRCVRDLRAERLRTIPTARILTPRIDQNGRRRTVADATDDLDQRVARQLARLR